MNRDAMLARMQAILDTAAAEGRGFTSEEQTEFEGLKARVDGLDATTEAVSDVARRRAAMPALRQQSGIPERIERGALRPSQSLAALFPRPAGDERGIGDFVRASLGMQPAHGMRAEQAMGTGATGGFTVPTWLSAELFDKARAKSRVIQAGMRTVMVPSPEATFATVEGDPEINQKAENQAVTASTITLGARNFRANTYIATVESSVELVEDSPNWNQVVEDILAAAMAVRIDRLALLGNGIGQQLGIVNAEGVHTVDGSSFDSWAPFSRAIQAIAASNYAAGPFIVSPGVLGAIDGLVDTTGQPLRRPPSLEQAAFLDSTSVPDGDASPAASFAVTGQWDQALLAVRTGLVIESTRTGGDAFGKLQVLTRIYSRLDSFPIRPEAFAVVQNIPVPVIV